ncbi:MAG: helix-turn-helix transcriptional regulator [Bacteroidota bacterium]
MAFLSIGTLFIAMFTIFLLLFKKQDRYFWAIICLLTIVVQSTLHIVYSIPILSSVPKLLHPALLLLFPPALYFYAKRILLGEKNSLGNILPYLLPVLAVMLFIFFFPPLSRSVFESMKAEGIRPSKWKMVQGEFFRWSQILVTLFFYGLTWRLLNQHQEKHHEYFAHEDIYNTFRWMRWIVIIAVAVFLVQKMMMFDADPRINLQLAFLPEWIRSFAVFFIASLFAFFVSSQSILVPSDFSNTNNTFERIKESESLTDEFIPTVNAIDNQTLKEIIAYLEQRMNEHQDYLKPKIKIADIAQSIDIPAHQLSKAINEHYGYNFFHFINKYRIEYAKKLLKQLRIQQITIDGIGMESGFSSRATFYNRFKEYTGMTPREYSAKTQGN